MHFKMLIFVKIFLAPVDKQKFSIIYVSCGTLNKSIA